MRVKRRSEMLSHSLTVFSSTSMPGKEVTSEPVAMRMFLALTFSKLPSCLFTVTCRRKLRRRVCVAVAVCDIARAVELSARHERTSFLPVIVPTPCRRVTLLALNSVAMPLVSALTDDALAPSSFGKLSLGSTSMPRELRSPCLALRGVNACGGDY